jgi:hypothetical protein
MISANQSVPRAKMELGLTTSRLFLNFGAFVLEGRGHQPVPLESKNSAVLPPFHNGF